MSLNRETVIILWLSINILVMQIFWLKAEKQASYLAGRASVYDELSMKETGVDVAFDCSKKACK